MAPIYTAVQLYVSLSQFCCQLLLVTSNAALYVGRHASHNTFAAHYQLLFSRLITNEWKEKEKNFKHFMF